MSGGGVVHNVMAVLPKYVVLCQSHEEQTFLDRLRFLKIRIVIFQISIVIIIRLQQHVVHFDVAVVKIKLFFNSKLKLTLMYKA